MLASKGPTAPRNATSTPPPANAPPSPLAFLVDEPPALGNPLDSSLQARAGAAATAIATRAPPGPRTHEAHGSCDSRRATSVPRHNPAAPHDRGRRDHDIRISRRHSPEARRPAPQGRLGRTANDLDTA